MENVAKENEPDMHSETAMITVCESAACLFMGWAKHIKRTRTLPEKAIAWEIVNLVTEAITEIYGSRDA